MYLLKPIAYILQTAIELRVLSERRCWVNCVVIRRQRWKSLKTYQQDMTRRLHVSATRSWQHFTVDQWKLWSHILSLRSDQPCVSFLNEFVGECDYWCQFAGLTRAEVCDAETGDCFGISFSLTANASRVRTNAPNLVSLSGWLKAVEYKCAQQTFTSTQMYMIESWLPVYLDEHSWFAVGLPIVPFVADLENNTKAITVRDSMWVLIDT